MLRRKERSRSWSSITERTPAGKVGSSWLTTASGPARSRLCITGSTSTQVGQSRLATMTRPLVGIRESGMDASIAFIAGSAPLQWRS